MKAPRVKYSVRLPVDLTRRLADHARSRRASQTAVIEAALESFLSPDGPERLEAAFSRRLDHMTRQIDRMQWNLDLSNETLAQFIRSWLINTSPLPEAAVSAAQAAGRHRWSQFLKSLTRRMEEGPRLGVDVARERSVGSD